MRSASSWRNLALGIAVPAAVALAAPRAVEALSVRRVEVEGNDRVSAVAVRHLADVPRGAFLPLVDLDGVVERVMRHPWIEAAEVRRVLPDGLVIEVREHRTALLLALDRLYRVAPDGTVFAQARPPGLDAPVLTGLDPDLVAADPDAGRRVVGVAIALLRDLDAHGPLGARDVSEVHFDPVGGFDLVLRSGARLHLGWRPPAEGLAGLATVLARGVSLDRPVSVDLADDRVALVRDLPS